MDPVKDLHQKLKSLLEEKKYSEIETELEQLGDLKKQPILLMSIYAFSKASNPDSNKKDFEIAVFFFDKLYEIDKSNLENLYNLAIVSLKAKTFNKVLPHLIERHKVDSKDEKVLASLAKAYFWQGKISESIKYSLQLIKVNPNYPKIYENLLASINYTYDIGQKDYLKYAIEFDQLNENKLEELNKKNKSTKSEKIKIGFISSDFYHHSVSFFLKDLLLKINKKEFEVFSFSNLELSKHDNMTNLLKKSFDKWNDIKGLSDRELLILSKNLDINIMIDLNGFTVGNRITALKARCAPLQISWLGYCNTLGIKNMDFLFSDKNLIKKEEENLYTEEILYLPNIWNSMSPKSNLPDLKKLPSKRHKLFTFGSFNNFTKISNECIRVWSKIINNSNSQIILKSGSQKSYETDMLLIEKFEEQGVDKNRIKILDRSLSEDEHLKEYNNIDVALDTFPHPGVTTSFEAIIMGVPVLTMKGFNFISRCGESINLNLKMPNFIALNNKDYYNKAIKLTSDLEALEKLRFSLREKALSSPLFNTDKFTKDFSNVLKKVWEDHLKNQSCAL